MISAYWAVLPPTGIPHLVDYSFIVISSMFEINLGKNAAKQI